VPYPLDHAAAVVTHLTRALAPAGVAVGDFHIVDLSASSNAMALTHDHAVTVCFEGWGPMLETHSRRGTIPLHRALDAEASAVAGMVGVADDVSHQIRMAGIARAAGVAEPIAAADRRRIDHLSIDRAALDVLIAVHGRDGLLDWIADQFEIRHRLALDKDDELTGLDTDMDVAGATFIVPVLFEPLRIGRGYATRGSPARDDHPPVWHGAELLLGRYMPETIGAAAVGRTVDAVYAGTPIGDRRIVDVDHIHFGDVHMTTFEIETDLVRVVEALRG